MFTFTVNGEIKSFTSVGEMRKEINAININGINIDEDSIKIVR